MALQSEVQISWLDSSGRNSKTVHTLQAAFTLLLVKAFVTAMAACSNAKCVGYNIFTSIAVTPTVGAPGPYQSTIDKAKMSYIGPNNQTITTRIPAPQLTDFLSLDKLTVDISNGAVIAFNTAFGAHATDASGNPIIGFESGIRSRGKGRRLSK